MHEAAKGVQRDLVQAYKWYAVALSGRAAPHPEMRKIARKGQTRVEESLPASELARARRLAREWQPETVEFPSR